ncbi:MAG: hypothetical protein EOP06_11145 [Proteobacteria bacterium]|nr:MAG: hypothetical protein EOP06_11145 [Pseudomonadota bacterium]
MKAIERNFWEDTVIYVSRVKEFDRNDWLVYICWIGMMMGLLVSICAFLFAGYSGGVQYPIYVWNIPIGTFVFVAAIALDTIGHRTVYKEALKGGEALVHHITIFAGISSVLGLCLAYQHPEIMYMPILVMIALSVIYSLVDEIMHWRRYLTSKSDRVEMWSHVFILTGHMIMVFSWWHWYTQGYPGVKETLLVMTQR